MESRPAGPLELGAGLLFGEDISESLLELLANGRVAGKGLERVFKLAPVARQFIGRQVCIGCLGCSTVTGSAFIGDWSSRISGGVGSLPMVGGRACLGRSRTIASRGRKASVTAFRCL